MPVNNLIKLRRGTDWNSNPVLSQGEPGFDTTNNILKIGDGTTAWSGLSPIGSGLDYLRSHPNISAANSSDNTGRTYIQDVLLDSNGHVIGISTGTESVVNTDTTYTAGTGLDLSEANQFNIDNTVIQNGDNVSLLNNDAGYLTSFTETNDLSSSVTWVNVPNANITESSVIQHSGALRLTESQIVDLQNYLTSHPTIASAASSSDNSGRTYIQDVLLDSNGHVIGITTATETVTDTNTEYTAGTGIALQGTEFNIEPSLISGRTEATSVDADYLLIWDATDSELKKVDAGEFLGGGDIVDDTTPQLGGNLDLNSQSITGVGSVDMVGNIFNSGVFRTAYASVGNYVSIYHYNDKKYIFSPNSNMILQPGGHSDVRSSIELHNGGAVTIEGDNRFATHIKIDPRHDDGTVIFPNGNIGIGTDSPGNNKFRIHHNTARYNSENTAHIKIQDSESNIGGLIGADVTDDVLYIQAIDPGTSWGKNISMQAMGGSVGIGTIDPGVYKFRVKGGHSSFEDGNVQFDGGNVTINQAGGNYDFRVEGDSNTHLLFTDASTDRVGIGTDNPLTTLHVSGTTSEGTILSQTALDTSWAGLLIRNQDNVNVASFQYGNSGVTHTPSLDNTLIIGSRQSGVPVKFYQGKEIVGAFKENNERIIFDTSGNTILTAATGQHVHISGVNLCINTDYPTSRKVTIRAGNSDNSSAVLMQGTGVGSGNTDGFLLSQAHDGTSYVWNFETKPLIFANANTERMRLESDGKLSHYGTAATIADGSAYELDISSAAATLGGNRLQLKSAETVFNEDGGNYDFRVEGDTDANLLFLDASKDSVIIGNSNDGSLNSKLHVYEVGNFNTTNSRTVNILGRGYSTTDGTYYHIANNSRAEKYLSASTTDAGYCIGVNAVPVIYSPDGTNALAEVTALRANASINTAASNVTVTNAYDIKTVPYFQGTNNTVTNHYGLYLGDAGAGGTTPTNEYGVYQVNTAATNYFGGTLDVRGAAVFNEGGGNFDFRVEGDTQANLLVCDASTDRVGIGTDSPSVELEVDGNMILDKGSANRPTKIHGDSLGFISKKGDSGGWQFSIDAIGASDTVYKGFGFYGSADTLNSIWIGGAYNTPYAKFTTTETVLNENGADRDLRVEGDTDTDLLLVDAGNDIVQIGKLNINGAFTLPTADGSANQILKTDGNGAVSWAADGGGGGGGGSMTTVKANGSQVGGADIVTLDFASDFTVAETPDTEVNISIADGAISSAKMTTSTLVLNEAGAAVDFRVEGDTDTHLLFVDGSADKVGIGLSTPTEKLDVDGNIKGGIVHATSGLNVGVSGLIHQSGTFVHSTEAAWGEFPGNAQNSINLLTGETTNATFTSLQMNNGMYSGVKLPSNKTFFADVNIVGRRTNASNSTSQHAAYQLKACINNDGFGRSVIGSVGKTVVAESNSAWDVQLAFAGAGSGQTDYLLVQCKGAASTNVHWVAKVDLLEVGGLNEASNYREANIYSNMSPEIIP